MRPRVSVIIPCFNAATTLARAIASVRAQAIEEIEIIVVDDGSSDGTSAAAARLGGDDLHLIVLPENGGVSRARNAGLAAAQGAFVAFLDADDEWLPGKLARQLAVIEAAPAVGLVATAAESSSRQPVFPAENVPATGPDAWRKLLAYPFVLTSAALIRADILRRVGPFDETLPVAEDQDMWIRIALCSDVAYIDEVFVIKYERRRSLSNSTPLGGAHYTLPVVLRHLERNRDRLGRAEARAILGRRLTLEGRNAYYDGVYGAGLAMLARAILLAHLPLANCLFLIKHAPPARWLRRRLDGRTPPSISTR